MNSYLRQLGSLADEGNAPVEPLPETALIGHHPSVDREIVHGVSTALWRPGRRGSA